MNSLVYIFMFKIQTLFVPPVKSFNFSNSSVANSVACTFPLCTCQGYD